MIVVLIFLFIAVLGLSIGESFIVLEEGSPAKDSDILEMLETYKADFDVDRKWNDKFKLKASYRSNAPSIHQTSNSVIFPYYISGVGVVPIWYKSTSKIKQMFVEKISASKYTSTKRDKLGLK